MTGDIRVSVVICTHNRAEYLAKALAGLEAQRGCNVAWETIIVDNASNDATAELAASWVSSRPAERQVLFEPQPGLSRARNRGWRAARGEFVAYLDDDAIPTPGWLAALTTEIGRGEPHLAIIAGKVEPIWEAPRPEWLSERMVPFLSMLDHGPQRRILGPSDNIVGANFAARRALLQETGGFDEQLGRRGRRLISNEELALKASAQAVGGEVVYIPPMRVLHHAPGDRLSVRWFRRRFFWQGYSDRLVARTGSEPGPGGTVRLVARYARRARKAPPASPERLDATMDIAYYLGALRGLAASRFGTPA